MVQRVVGSGYHCTFTGNQKESLLAIKSDEKKVRLAEIMIIPQKIIQPLQHQKLLISQ